MLLGICAGIGAAVIYGAASIFQAAGSRRAETSANLDPWLLFRLLREPAFVTALVLMLTGFLLHLVALRNLPLYLAQSAIAGSLAVTAVLAVTVYHEHLHPREWTAVGAVVVGLALLTAAGGSAGTSTASSAVKLGLVLGIVVIVLGAVAAARVHNRAGTAALGLLAGLGYATVGVSGRLLPSSGFIASPVTYTLAIGGGLAFLLYSQALQRGAVTTVTGPMIAVQTAVPSLVGLLFLSDRVRPGWGIVAVAGFVLAAAGTLVLVRFEDASTPGGSAQGTLDGGDQAARGDAEQAGQGGVGGPRPARGD